MSAPRNKSLTRIHAGDSIKKFQFKEELSYIPATFYRASKQRSIPGLAVLPFRSAVNDMSSTVSPNSREISPDVLGSSTILKPDLLYKTMKVNNVLKVDREHTKVDFSKKSSDVSYLMETKPYLREQRNNEYSAHMIKRSIDMLSPKNQSNTVEYSILNNSQYKDDKPVSRRGRTNIYLEMKGFGKDKEDSAFSETLKKLKSPVTAETSLEKKGTSNVNRSIDIDNNNVSRVLPKIIDASKLGSTIDIPDASDEIKDNFMTKLKKGAIVQKRAQNKHLSVPSGRKEVVTLSDWLGTMLEDMQKKKTVGISELFDQTQLIYTVGLEEIIRQVKLQCSERGQILEKIWEAYTDLFNKAVEVSKKEKKQLESLHMNEMTEFRLKYEKDIGSHKQNIEELTQELDEKRSSLEQEMERREFFEGKSERLTKDLFELKHELHVAQTEVQKLINTTILLKSERRATVRAQEQQQVQVAPVEEQITETEDETEEDDSFNRELLIKYKERFGFVESEKKDMETETADLEVYIKENVRNAQNEKEFLDKSVQYEVDEMAAENEGETSEEDSEQEDEEQSDEGSEKETQIAHSAQEMLEIQNLEEMKMLKDALHRMTAMELKELDREIRNRLSIGESGKKSKKDKKDKKTKKRKNKDRQASPAGITKDDVIEMLEKYQEDNVYPSLKEIPAEEEMMQFMLQYLKGDEQWKFKDLKHLVKKITKRKAHSLDLDHEYLINEAELNSDLKSLTGLAGDQLSQNIKTMSKQNLTKIVADVEKKLEEVINGNQQNSNNQELIALLKRLLEERSDLLEGGNHPLFKKILEAYENEINQNMGLRIENKEQYMDLKDLESRYENNENRARHLERQIEEVSEKNQHLKKTNEKLTKILTKKRTLEQEAVTKKLQQLDSLMSGYTSGPGIDSKDSEGTTERERLAHTLKGITDGSADAAGNKRSQNENPGKIKENIAEMIKMTGSDFEEDWSDSDEKTDRFTDREDKPKYLSTKTLSMFANQRKSKATVFVTKPVDGLTSKKIVRVTSVNGESANNLLVKAKEKKNIKSSLTKGSFLKFMCQFYVDKLKDTKKSQRTPLHVTVYESFMNKYGLKKVAETKCLQIYEAAIAFSESKRIMRFRELLGLGESVEVLEELSLYLTTLRQLDPSSGGVLVASNTQEKIFIGLEQAEAVTIAIFESKLDPKNLKEVLISLPKIKSVDRASRTVELEDFIDKLFYVQKNLKNTVKGFVREIFGATDLDNDETLQLFEFNILYKHVERDRYDKEQVRDLFFEHADMILTDGSNEPVISFNKFAWICLEMKLFSEEKQKIFSRVSDASDPVQTVKDLEENLKQKFNELRLRFLKSKAYTPQIRNIMTKLYSSVKNPQKSRTIVWLSYRLLDEESKVQLLDHEIRMMLPKEFSIIQRFVDEIEGWLDNTHPTEI